MKIIPIAFGKKYKKPRTGKREIQRTQVQMSKMSPEVAKAEIIKQANFALGEVDKIKQIANSAKIRSFEVLEKAKKNKEFADGLYLAIKENSNSASKNFSIQYQGITYKVDLQNGKYKAIGQSRGFFGKKDIFEYKMKNGELITSVLKGYLKEKDSSIYTVAEEYHYIQNGNIKVMFDTQTDKFKKAKEGFSFVLGSELSQYHTNIKVAQDDFDYGEFETSISYSVWLKSKLRSYTVGLKCFKDGMQDKHCWNFAPNGMLQNYHQDCSAKSKGDVCDVKFLIGFKDDKLFNGVVNMHVVNEKPSYEYQYQF